METSEDLESRVRGTDPSLFHATSESPGRYTRPREHARGGMGRILAVHDEQLGREIVIKELVPDRDTDATQTPQGDALQEPTPAAVRFVREARITGQLEHPSIVPIHELGFRENGDLYYTMKHVQGRTVAEAVSGAESLEQRLKLLPHVLDVCQAIAYAHSRGVIHRDIKPANIMVGSFGETVLLDWGLAFMKVLDPTKENEGFLKIGPTDPRGDSGHTMVGQILGTPAYMSPEQARGHSSEVDERIDVYGLGALLYTVLTGTAPFSGDSQEDIVQQLLNAPPRPIRECVPNVAPELAAICDKAMAKAPTDRYDSAQDLVEDMQRYLSGALVVAYRYRWQGHLQRFLRRNTNILFTVGVSAILLLVLATFSYTRVQKERDKSLTNLALAESHLRLAQGAVDSLLTEVSDNELMNLPQLEPVRQKLLETALSYCEQISQQRPRDDPESLRQIARAQGRLGQIYALLGQQEKALSAYGAARDAYRVLSTARPDDKEPERELVMTYSHLGELYRTVGQYEDALDAYGLARAGAAALESRHPDNLEYRIELAKAEWGTGTVQKDLDRTTEAVTAFEHARDLFAGVDDTQMPTEKTQLSLAQSWQSLGETHLRMLHVDKALNAYKKAHEIRENLVDVYPNGLEHQINLAITWNGLGLLFVVQGNHEQAYSAYVQARDGLHAVVEAHPDVPVYQQKLAMVLGNMGALYEKQGSYNEALKLRDQARSIYENLVEAHPNVPEYQNDLAREPLNTAFIYRKLSRQEEALVQLTQSEASYVTLAENYPEIPSYRSNMAAIANHMGVFYNILGRYEEAVSSLHYAITLSEALVEAYPTVPMYLSNLSSHYNNLGAVELYHGQNNAAMEYFEKSRETDCTLVESYPAVPAYRDALSRSLNNLGNIYMVYGKLDMALQHWTEARELAAALAKDYPDVPEYRLWHGLVLNNLADTQILLGRSEDALRNCEESREIGMTLLKEQPDVPDNEELLARTWNNLGRVYGGLLGKHEEALAAYQQNLELHQKLFTANPNVPAFQDGLAISWSNVGIAHGDLGQTDDQLAAYLKARELAEALVKDYPEVPRNQYVLVTVLRKQYSLYMNLGKHEEARAANDTALQLEEGLANAHPEVPQHKEDWANTLNSSSGLYEPARGIEMLNKAVELTERKDGNILDTLADALAANGRLEDAVLTQRESLAVLDDAKYPGYRKDFEKRLQGYEAHLTWEQTKDSQLLHLQTALGGTRIAEGSKASWSADGRRVAHGGWETGISIRTLGADKSTQICDFASHFGWSPDGQYIAWNSEDKELWFARPSGKGRRKLGVGRFRGWSGDGKKVYATPSEGNQLISFDVDAPGAEAEVFFDELLSKYARVSPDGSRIAFAEDDRLVIVDRKTRTTLLTWSTPGPVAEQIAWSSSGTKLAFSADHVSPYDRELWVLDLDKKEAVQVLRGPYMFPDWSSDGSKLLFSLPGMEPPEIWTINTKALDNLPRVHLPEE